MNLWLIWCLGGCSYLLFFSLLIFVLLKKKNFPVKKALLKDTELFIAFLFFYVFSILHFCTPKTITSSRNSIWDHLIKSLFLEYWSVILQLYRICTCLFKSVGGLRLESTNAKLRCILNGKLKGMPLYIKIEMHLLFIFFSLVYVCRINLCISRLGWNIEVNVKWDLRILKLTNENAFFLPLASIRKMYLKV